jgi:type II secretory pathway component PulM
VNELRERLLNIWDNFAPRERLLLSVLAASLAATLVFVAGVRPVLSAREAAHERVEAAEKELEVMARLRREYEEINARLSAVEAQIRQNQDRRNTLTLLESLASAASVKIDSMEERSSPDNDQYRETRVEVSLKNVTLTQVVSLLHNIETSPRQFSVKGLRIKNRADKNDLLEVAFTVSTFEAI